MKHKQLKTKQGNTFLIDLEDFLVFRNFSFSEDKDGYIICYGRISGKIVKGSLHRILLKAQKGQLVDHVNRNIKDNRKRNLRICTAKENARNKTAVVGSYSKYLGVSWHTTKKCWVAVCQKKHIGWFVNEEAAALAYNEAAIEKYGEFASLNNVAPFDYNQFRRKHSPRPHPKKRHILCITDNKEFTSIREASDFYGYNYGSVRTYLSLGILGKYNLIYKDCKGKRSKANAQKAKENAT